MQVPYTTGTTATWNSLSTNNFQPVPQPNYLRICRVPFFHSFNSQYFFIACAEDGIQPNLLSLEVYRTDLSGVSCVSNCINNVIAGSSYGYNVVLTTPYLQATNGYNSVQWRDATGQRLNQTYSSRFCDDWNAFLSAEGKCTLCNPSCQEGESSCISTDGGQTGQCACLTGFQQSAQGVCSPSTCPPGLVGIYCNLTCSCPIPGTHCQIASDGLSINCLCSDSLYLNPITNQCETQSCGIDRASLCSNAGVCIQSGVQEYCLCDRGQTGQFCQQNQTNYDECDCGVQWATAFIMDGRKPFPSGYYMLSDATGMPLPSGLSFSLLGQGIQYVGNEQQAMHLCYLDGFCDGVALRSVPFYQGQFQAYQAVFLTRRYSNGQMINALPSGTRVHLIDRSSLYRCKSLAPFDAQYYLILDSYNNARVVNTFCIETGLRGDPSCNFLAYWAVRHWRYAGHLSRQSPNANCNLLPIVFEPESFCETPRCLSVGYQLPCNGHGHCIDNSIPNTQQPYVCECDVFSSGLQESNAFGLDGKVAWIGNACQFSVAEFCVRGSDPVLCSGYQSVCKPKRAWNGEFFLLNFEDGLHDDYLPYCDCTGLPATGQYCELSMCGATSRGCQALGSTKGNCISSDGGQSYHCECAADALGEFCQIDATRCVYNGLSCAGQGECKLVNGTTACQCQTGAFGPRCEFSSCSHAVMIPGHGVCADGILSRCYAPYSGVNCAQDNCALFGGSVVGSPPSGCSCPSGSAPRLNGITVATCWPQCPVINGSVCGAGQHRCLQTVTGVSRVAVCECATGYLLETDSNGNQFCAPFCVHGTPAANFNPLNPVQPCVCDPSTGFDTAMNHPRCDHPICGDFGSWNGNSCDCLPPYTKSSNCISHGCGSKGAVVSWIDVDATSQYRCSCESPFAPSTSAAPYDCSGSVCAPNGARYPFWKTQPMSEWCTCFGNWRTNCANPDLACQFCAMSTCLNGGFPSPEDSSTCLCPFPYINGPLGTCEVYACPYAAGVSACICNDMHNGQYCEQGMCLNGNFNTTSETCECDSDWGGMLCDVDLAPPTVYVDLSTAATIRPWLSLVIVFLSVIFFSFAERM